MKEIKLTRGKIALVDDSDYEWLNQWKWYASPSGKLFYAERMLPRGSGKRQRIKMHQAIMGMKGVDHKNGNGCDNQRGNMRTCTHQQNCMNRRKQAGCAFKHKGVFHDRRRKTRPYGSQIRINYKLRFLGYFATQEESALAYNKAATKLFGEFARINILPEV